VVSVSKGSPFKFLPKTEALTAAAEEEEEKEDEAMVEEDALAIKGTIGSYAIGLPVNAGSGSQEYLHILAGNWSLTIDRDNNAAGLQANFTSVRADGTDRHMHTLAANAASAIQFDDQLAAMTISNLPVNIETDSGEVKSVNVTVTILRLNTIKIDLDGQTGQLLGQPVYGITTMLNTTASRRQLARTRLQPHSSCYCCCRPPSLFSSLSLSS
jgi:hypothetical protein